MKTFFKWLFSFFKSEDKPESKPDPKPEPTPEEEPKEEEPKEEGSLIQRLADLYKGLDIEFYELKDITLAQWLLESGRGTSKLSVEHNNFAGLKWRTEMANSPGASAVSYEAHDGRTEYCRFDSMENFIKGYWNFLERSPYRGWKLYEKDPKRFLKFIVDAGYCPDVGYYEKVISLLPEATAMLDDDRTTGDRPRDNEDTDKPDDGGDFISYPEDKEYLWYPPAIKSEAKMRTRGYYKDKYPQGAVVHFTAGRSRTKDEGGGSRNPSTHLELGKREVNTAVNNAAYAYFVIDRAGNVYQNFPLNRWGQHAGTSSWKGLSGSVSDELVGIEVQNAGKLKAKGKDYVAWFTVESSGDGVFKEHEARYTEGKHNQEKGHYHKFSEAQEEALMELLIWLKRNNPDVFSLSLVLGHDEVSPSRKNDPGASLSLTMPEYRSKLQEEYVRRYS